MTKKIRFVDKAGYERDGVLKDEEIFFADETYDMGDVSILPPSDPSKIICIGRNYEDHARETGSEIPDRPLLFLKAPNAVMGHKDTIPLLQDKERIDYEAELAVIIDEQCKNVSVEDADQYIKGYTCFNDVSNRDDQRKEKNWVRGKAFDYSAPMGPVLATPDELPEDAKIQLIHNGDVKQNSKISNMHFTVPELISEISSYLTLEPGDVIATGTPASVGPIKSGDEVEVYIEGIGRLVNYFE